MDAYDVDGFDTSKRTVDRIHDNSSKAICYVNVGAWENWRPDKKKFPKSVLGPEARDREGPLRASFKTVESG